MTVSFRNFKISWNLYFLNNLCKTWAHGRYLIDCSSAPLSKFLTLPNLKAFIPSKFLILLMGFPRFGVAFYSKTADECTEASCLRCAMYGLWVLNACHLIPQVSRANCISQVINSFEEALSVGIQSQRLSVSSKQSWSSFKCTASLALVCWPLSDYSFLAFKNGKEYAINVIKSELYIM